MMELLVVQENLTSLAEVRRLLVQLEGIDEEHSDTRETLYEDFRTDEENYNFIEENYLPLIEEFSQSACELSQKLRNSQLEPSLKKNLTESCLKIQEKLYQNTISDVKSLEMSTHQKIQAIYSSKNLQRYKSE
jgi:hypothetical protein